MRLKYTFLLFVLAVVGCQPKSNYYYVEDSKGEELIKAATDSAAYMEAYQNFVISKKVYNDMKQAGQAMYLKNPQGFNLYNSKKENITFLVTFPNKAALEADIMKRISEQPSALHGGDSLNIVLNRNKYDTAGLYLAPVKVTSANFTRVQYSNYKDIALRFRNVSQKAITAIRFRWHGENAFGEPADMGGIVPGVGGGFTDEILRQGGSSSGEWSILSRDGKKVLIAYPIEVAFKDGTKWALN